MKEFDCELYRKKKETIKLIQQGRERRRIIYKWWRSIRKGDSVNTFDNPFGFVSRGLYSKEDGECRLCGVHFTYQMRFSVTPIKKSNKIGDVYFEITPKKSDLCDSCNLRRKRAISSGIYHEELLDLIVINRNIKEYGKQREKEN